MTLPDRVRRAADALVAGEASVDDLVAVLGEVRSAPAATLQALGPELVDALAQAHAAIEAAREEIREALAGSVRARRGLQGFGHLEPSTVGQRVNRRA